MRSNRYKEFGMRHLSGQEEHGLAVYMALLVPALLALGAGVVIASGHEGFDHLLALLHHAHPDLGKTLHDSISSGALLPPFDPADSSILQRWTEQYGRLLERDKDKPQEGEKSE